MVDGPNEVVEFIISEVLVVSDSLGGIQVSVVVSCVFSVVVGTPAGVVVQVSGL